MFSVTYLTMLAYTERNGSVPTSNMEVYVTLMEVCVALMEVYVTLMKVCVTLMEVYVTLMTLSLMFVLSYVLC